MPVGQHEQQGQVPFARKDKSRWKPGTCIICDTLTTEDLLAFDLLVADPKRWPKETWAGIKLPPGIIRPRYRLWGAAKIGEEWLKAHGYWPAKMRSRPTLRRHINRHVQWTADDLSTIAAQGQMAEASQKAAVPAPADLTPMNYRHYFDKGIKIGLEAQDRMLDRLQEAKEQGLEIPSDLLLKLMDHGARLATAAANLAVKGVELDRDRQAELDGFRAGSAPIPVRASKHHVIHVIDGESRPVADEGRGDRRDYNEKAREEGGVELPA